MLLLRSEIRRALRSVVRSRGVTFSLLGIIALAIGASAAIWSAASSVLLRPLPYADPERLVLVWNDLQKRDVRDFPFPPADFEDLRTGTRSFEGFAGIVTSLRPVSGDGGDPEQVPTAGATPNLFTLLGAPMALGRMFEEADGYVDDSSAPNPPPDAAAARRPGVAILTYEFWRRRYGGDPGILGRRVVVGNSDAEVVGVLAPGFQLLFPPGTGVERQPAVYTALRIDYGDGSRSNAFLRVIGRLRPGVTLAAAQAELTAVEQDLKRRFEIKESAGMRIRVEGMHQDLVADVRTSVLALFGAAVLLLLIGCASIGGLILVRVLRNERDLSIRRALGGSAWAITQALLLETAAIGFAGIGAGLVVALGILGFLTRYAPADLPRFDSVEFDWASLAVASAAVLLTLTSFSLLPILRSLRADGSNALRAAGVGREEVGARSARDLILIAQVSLSFVLLAGSGLLLRSFVALHQVEPGFGPQGLLTFSVGSARELDTADREQFGRAFRERLQALPGVVSASAVGPLPLDGTISNVRWGTEEAAADPERFQQATAHFVMPGYFETMRTRVLAGRSFTPADDQRDCHGVVIDRLLAEKAFPNGNAVGRQLLVRVRGAEPERVEVIGVVDHQRHVSLAREGPEAIFFPNAFVGYNGATRWVVRTTGDRANIAQEVRTVLRDLDPMAALAQVRPMTEVVSEARAQTRFALLLLVVFSFLSVILTAAGIYSSISTAARQRTKEIGVRLALGASTSTILVMMVGKGMWIGAAGLFLGAVLAFVLTRHLTALLVGVSSTDPVTLLATALAFAGVIILV